MQRNLFDPIRFEASPSPFFFSHVRNALAAKRASSLIDMERLCEVRMF